MVAQNVKSKFDRTDMVKINEMVSAASQVNQVEDDYNPNTTAQGWSYGRMYNNEGTKISLSQYRHLHQNTSEQKIIQMYKNWSIESQLILEKKMLYQKNFNAQQLLQQQKRKRAVSLMREQKSAGGLHNHVVFKVEKPNDNTGLRHSFST